MGATVGRMCLENRSSIRNKANSIGGWGLSHPSAFRGVCRVCYICRDTDQGCLCTGLLRPSLSLLIFIRQIPHSHFGLSVIAGGLKSIGGIVNRQALEDMVRATEHHKAREAIVFYGIHLAW